MDAKKWYAYIPAYLFVILAGAIGFFILLDLRDIVGALASRLDTSAGKYWIPIADKVFVVIFAGLLLIFILFTENYLRKSVEKGRAIEAALRVTGWDLLILGLSYFGVLIASSAPFGGIPDILLASGELAAGILLILLSVRRRRTFQNSKPEAGSAIEPREK